LLHRKLEYKLLRVSKDNKGRILILDLEIKDGIVLTIGNIYAPTRDKEGEQLETMKELHRLIEKHENSNIILGGDFNCYLDPKLDRADKLTKLTKDNKTYRTEILGL
jgi:exonuclease III